MVQSQEKLPHTSQNDTKLIKIAETQNFSKLLNWPLFIKIKRKMDQYSENLVDQIDQNELWNLLKLTKMNEREG